MDINTNLRVCLAGCGINAGLLASQFNYNDDAELTACFDPDYDRAAGLAERYGIHKIYDNFNSMLDEETPDAVIMNVPVNERTEILLDVIGRGVSFISTAPLAASYPEAVEIAKAASEQGVTAMVYFGRSDIPAVASAIDYVAAGNIGKVRHFEASNLESWMVSGGADQWDEDNPLIQRLAAGGVLEESGAQLYYLADRFCGDFADVSTIIKSFINFEEGGYDPNSGDSFASNITFKNGGIGIVHASRAAGGTDELFRISVYGDNGMVSVVPDSDETGFLYTTADGSSTSEINNPPAERVIDRFISACRGEALPFPDLEYALKIQYYLEQSRFSDEGGIRMPLDQA